jgi:hemin uptake protein HemP
MSSKDAVDRDGREQAMPETQPPKVVRLRVAELLGDAREAILEHGSQAYRLRITHSGKLILTK